MKKLILSVFAVLLPLFCLAQDGPLRFAFMTDLHYSKGSSTIKGLQACINDINANERVDFVLLGGDITDFGTDEEIADVKALLDQLKVKYYIVAGNHDSTWSESGCNSFIKIFGYERYMFEAGGWRFIGCNCGPDMRMAPALLPKECLVWLDGMEKGKKTIFVNHYPQDTSVLNYFDVTKQLKKIGVQFELGGHWHSNRALNYDGIPGVLMRDSYSGVAPGYNIIELTDNHVSVSEKRVYKNSSVLFPAWFEKDLAPVEDKTQYDADGLPTDFPWMKYDVNETYSNVKELWKVSDDANIVAGFAINGDVAYYPTTTGYLRAISLKDGSRLWTQKFGGKIFSTPACDGKRVVFGCTDNYIYCVNADNGKTLWKVKCNKSVVGSPYIKDGVAYIGSSDGIFRAINMKNGKLVWKFEGVEGFVVCTPYVDDEQVVFGCWGQRLYSLDTKTGALQWKWKNPRSSRMYSPAATVPVKSNGRIFIAIPDRHVYALDAKTGEQLFCVNGGREAIGLSQDGKTVFAKSMVHSCYAFPSDVALSNVKDGTLQESALTWKNDQNKMGYEIGPTPIVETEGTVIYPADKGNILAFDAKDGSFKWAHKISVALVNPIKVWKEGGATRILASTMDAKITLLEF